VEVRAKAIAVFFAVFFAAAQCFGALGPWLYGQLIGDGTDHFGAGCPTGTVTGPAEPARVRSMKKLIVLAVLVGLGIFAAQKLRSS
jgi:hypothetical protein